MQAALAERAARQAAAERAAARQRRGKRKVGEHEDAAEGEGNAAAPSTRQEAARPGTMATTTVAPPDRQAVEAVGSSGGPAAGTTWQPSTASQGTRGGQSSTGVGILRSGRVPDFEAAMRWAVRGVGIGDREALSKRSPAQNLNAAMVGLVEALHCQTVYTCQMAGWQEKFNQQASKIAELDAQVVKEKEMGAKLEASLKEIEERRITEIAELLLRCEKAEAASSESSKKLEERDAELASARSRVAELEAQIGELKDRHQDEMKKQQEEIFDKLFSAVDAYRRSALYGVQLLRGPLDLRAIDLGRVYTPPEGFNVLQPSRGEVEAGRARDGALITPPADESEGGGSGDEAGVSSTRE